MAESRMHEEMNSMWPTSLNDGSGGMVDHYGTPTVASGLEMDNHSKEEFPVHGIYQGGHTVANGMEMDDGVKEEELEDIEDEDPIDPDFIAKYGVGGSQNNSNGMAMLNNMFGNSRTDAIASSLITSTTPLDLASLLQAASKEDKEEEPRPSSLTPNGGRRGMKRDSSEGPSINARRKASNREAANRYRERKKQEMEVMRIDEEALTTRNAQLRQIEVALMEEIRQMRETMIATFGFAPPYQSEPSIFDVTASCMLLTSQDKTPKRIPFPKGLSPAEQNRESVRRDREKKKARFESLKAEEAILLMGKQMLTQQVQQLEAEIRMMKERMRGMGMTVPDIY